MKDIHDGFCKATEGRSSNQLIAQISEETIVQIRVLAVQGLVQLDTQLKSKQLLLPKSRGNLRLQALMQVRKWTAQVMCGNHEAR